MSKKIDKIELNVADYENLISSLKALELNSTEAHVYIALLAFGRSNAGGLEKATGLKRTTIYSAFSKLMKKGLIHFESNGLKRVVVAEEPKKLELILEQKKKILQNITPTLQSIFHIDKEQSFVKYYEGIESIKPLYETLIADIKPNEEYMIFSNPELWTNQDKGFFENFALRRAQLPIKIMRILEDNDFAKNEIKRRGLLNSEIKLLPSGIKIESNMVITPQKILIHDLNSPNIALVMENSVFIKMHQEMYRLIWNFL